jgi:glyoxylase-like metal-dependent hydrolase (beta-lactamase superfamily II)/rhodanese-related sulfurtransferase
VLFTQFVDDDLGCGSYLIGDEHAGVAVVVDPAYAVEQYLDACERHGVRLVGVLETHTHADHLSGHGRLALEHGIPVRVHEAAGATFLHEPLFDGTEIELGDVVVRTIHTPGHRPEHCSFAVTDRSRASEPWLVLTGDSLFVGDAARPDLAVEAHDGADELFRSLHRLVDLGDGVEVYPGHVAGSLCGASMSLKASTTIGFERRFNDALVASYDDFMAKAAGPLPPRPPNLERIVELNSGPFVAARPLLARADDVDAIVLDVRDAHEFAADHRPGAVNVPVAGLSFGTKSAFVLPEHTLVIEARDEEQAQRAARALHTVGIFDIAGWRDPGAGEALEPVTIDELERLLTAGEIEIFDVREAEERDAGSIPGSRHLPYRLARQAAENGLCTGGRPIVTICEHGARAAVAASVLQAAGLDARPVLDGGLAAWRERGGKTTCFRRCGAA